MTEKIYAVLDPVSGEYTRTKTLAECLAVIAESAYYMLMHYTNNSPYSVVQINDDGTESWSSPAGDEIMSPTQLKEVFEKKLNEKISMSNLVSIPPTPIETLP